MNGQEMPNGQVLVALGVDPMEPEPVFSQDGDDLVVDFDPQEFVPGAGNPDEGFYENLVDKISPQDLSKIASTVIQNVDADATSRADWVSRFERGMIMMGLVKDEGQEAYPGGSIAVHPLFAEAVVQYQARALEEFLPASGPAKARIMGKTTPELEEQKGRVEGFLNYQMMTEDREYFWDTDKMLLAQAMFGSQFRIMYYDRMKGRVLARHIPGHRFLVPYEATNLEDAPRFTRIIPISHNDLKRQMSSGAYVEIDLPEPQSASGSSDTSIVIEEKIKESEGRTDPGLVVGDGLHTLYESYLTIDIGLQEDAPDFDLPYVVTVDQDTEKVLSVRRNWVEDDEGYNKIIPVVHYPFVSGLGFYSYGYIHLLGSVVESASGVMREIIDAGAFSALQGGFKSKDAKFDGDAVITAGKWIDTDLTAEELSKAFYTPPYKPPSPALFSTLGALVEAGRSLGSVTEARVGDANNTGPVGTTVALIEQGAKIHTAIHKRNHQAMQEELILRFRFNGDYLPDTYPYKTEGDEQEIFREDFNDSIDVLPVSDPNVVSSTQRIAIAQTTMELAKSAPSLYDMRAVHKRMHQAIKTANIKELMPDLDELAVRLDPVSENQLVMVGKPIRAFIDQDHQAHLIVHQQFMEMISERSPQHANILAPVASAHLAEHLAYQYRIEAEQMLGIPMPDVSLVGDEEQEELPADVEAMLSSEQAQAAQQVEGEESEEDEGGLSPEETESIADQARKDYAFGKEQDRLDQKVDREESRKDSQDVGGMIRQLSSNKSNRPSDGSTKDGG